MGVPPMNNGLTGVPPGCSASPSPPGRAEARATRMGETPIGHECMRGTRMLHARSSAP
jgi:hypothetical protein